jgi:hypothetical protein
MDATSTRKSRDARRAQWRKIVAEQVASGQNAAAFARARGLPAWKITYWRNALKPNAAPDAAGFVQMSVRGDEREAALWVEAGRWRIGVCPGFDPTTLRQVLEALGA